jgi:ABC-type lipoprotein release transport system permease subunit
MALTLVVLLVFVVVSFIRGLESSLAISGDHQVVIVHSLGSSENLENSSVPSRTSELLTASLEGIQRRYNKTYTSPEVYLGTQVSTEADEPSLGLVRGVTPAALLVRNRVQIVEGHWPGPGEVLVGQLAATKLGKDLQTLLIGKKITFEGKDWTICGRFASAGSTLESELWCLLDDLQQAMKRQDLSLVAITLAPGASFADVDEFCKERLDLELQATRETDYYAALERHYRPVRILAWTVVCLVAAAGIFTGLNTMYGAVIGRVRELATLQTLGFARRSLAISLIQEAALLAAAASLVSAILALLLVNGASIRFTMGAFVLRVDNVALLTGCATGMALGIFGAIPPAIWAMRLQIAEGLKAV